MTSTRAKSLSDSKAEQPAPNTAVQNIPTRSAEIGEGMLVQRALPSRHKRMIGAWCFLDHAGPVSFSPGQGLDVGPHPHMGLQTFTWMIEGTLLHQDSLGSRQLLCPGQVNLMTAGYGISHTEVSPAQETRMHTAQLWIALPDAQRHMPPKFEHYPQLPTAQKDQVEWTVLVGEFLGQVSPVQVYSPLLGVDLVARQESCLDLTLNPEFEHAVLALEGTPKVNGQQLTHDNMLVLAPGVRDLRLEFDQGQRLLLIGGQPFDTPILLWWNLVWRTSAELQVAREHWLNHDVRFGEVTDYAGPRMTVPEFPARMRATK